MSMDESAITSSDKDKTSCSIPENEVLTTIHEIIRVIFQHLPIRSVDSCSLVCQSWAHISRRTKLHRQSIHSLTYPLNPLLPSTICSNFLHDFDSFITTQISQSLWSLPTLAFVVATNILASKGFYSSSNLNSSNSSQSEISSMTRRTERFDVSEALRRHLNKSCKILMVAADGIIASTDDNQSNEIESNDAIGILFLPHLPAEIFGIFPFEIPSNVQISPEMSRSELHRYLGAVPDDVSIRCVIFFFVQRQSYAVDCIKKLIEYYPSQIAIIGGFVDKIHYDDRQIHANRTCYDACGIVITGDERRLNVGEILLENHIRTREQIREKLTELKYLEQKPCLSFAVQISCIARGSNYYNEESNVECSEFRRLFPETPLIGVFSNGELGCDYLPKNQLNPSNKSMKNNKESGKNLFRGYSTVFSLISLRL